MNKHFICCFLFDVFDSTTVDGCWFWLQLFTEMTRVSQLGIEMIRVTLKTWLEDKECQLRHDLWLDIFSQLTWRLHLFSAAWIYKHSMSFSDTIALWAVEHILLEFCIMYVYSLSNNLFIVKRIMARVVCPACNVKKTSANQLEDLYHWPLTLHSHARIITCLVEAER